MIDPITGLSYDDPLYQMLYGGFEKYRIPSEPTPIVPPIEREGDFPYGNDNISREVPPSPVKPNDPPKQYTPFDLGQFDPYERDSVNAAWDKLRGARKGEVPYDPAELDRIEKDVLTPAWGTSERDYQGDLGDFRTRQYVMEQLGDNFAEFEPEFKYFADKFRQDMPTSTPTEQIFSSYYGNGQGAGRSIIDQLQSRYRGRNTTAANSYFDVNRPYTDLPDTYDDNFIESIIGEQKPLAMQQLDFARKRGQLNDRGMMLAQTRLGNKEKEVRSNLSNKGGTLLEALRGKLGAVGTEARTNAAGSSIGDKFSLDPYKARYTNILTSGQNNLEGDLRSGLTGDEFSIKDLIGGSASQQGVSDGKNPNLLGALEDNKKRRSQARGLGTQGAF